MTERTDAATYVAALVAANVETLAREMEQEGPGCWLVFSPNETDPTDVEPWITLDGPDCRDEHQLLIEGGASVFNVRAELARFCTHHGITLTEV